MWYKSGVILVFLVHVGGSAMDDELEAVARAFYRVSGYEVSWERASAQVQALMREDARTAIRTIDTYQGHRCADDRVRASPENKQAKVSQPVH
jgi:hypothetical protein